ncbi:MAG: hypothetical protein KA538_08235 [Azonexus sp.]|jgi:hypothetical protein|nr:hypothetical protein [Azonexus sp.]
MHIPLGNLTYREGVDFGFPEHLCCNCGGKHDLQVIEQDTRRTTYLLAGGTETTFRLPLPFCPRCAPSAKRRPKNFVHRLLQFALAFGLSFLALLVLGEFHPDSTVLAKYLIPLSLFFAVIVMAVVVMRTRPLPGQSSYFQPVRIPVLKREFLSGAVTGIGFAFTSADYARAFRQLNKEAIGRKQVSVERA